MRYIELITTGDDYDHDPGFHIANTPKYEGFMADRTGAMIAHDLLEHQNGAREIGPVWDELEALGGIHWVRSQHGTFARNDRHGMNGTIESNLASDVTRMFSEWCWTDGHWRGPGHLNTRPCDFDETFKEVIDIARYDIPREVDMADYENFDELVNRYLDMALHRMRAGLRKAKRRFPGSYQGLDLFVAIRDAVGDAAKQIDYEGQRFRLAYGNGNAQVYPIYEEDY